MSSGALHHPTLRGGPDSQVSWHEEVLEAEMSDCNRSLPIFMAHGDAEPIVPLVGAEASRDRLKAAGYPVDWRTYPMPHAVHPDEILDIGRFLTSRLGA